MDQNIERAFQFVLSQAQQLNASLIDVHARLAAIEELLTNAELRDVLEAFVDGRGELDDIKKIVEEYVVPDMEAQAEMMREEAKRQQEKSNLTVISSDPDIAQN